ncbi:MAG: choline dehydrogenase-like flavoprotein [Kiritimatiellia bacterium]|jgi:choline dehydrogenase-like flavoprotein
MGLSFTETMQGHIVDRWGAQHRIDFQIMAEASHLGQFNRTGRARLTGVVHAPPWTDGAPLQGTITVRPVRKKVIHYRFTFRDEEDRDLVFEGEKHISWLRPLATVTLLHGELRHGAEVLGRGELRFDLNEVFEFAASYLRPPTIRQVQLRARGERGPIRVRLGSGERRLLLAFCEALIPGGHGVPAADERTLDETVDLLEGMPDPMITLYRAALASLNGMSRARWGRGFARATLQRRAQFLDELVRGEVGRGVVRLLGLPVRIAHFHRDDYLGAIGAPDLRGTVRDEPDAPWMARVTTAEELDEVTEVEAEVVVVGTGAGGAAVAARLAELGVAVLIIEEGQYHRRSAHSGPPLDRMRRFWRDGGISFSVGRPPISIPLGKMVGGTTAINSGTCFRTPDAVLREWRDAGFSADFSPSSMARLFDEVETELQVEPAGAAHLGHIGEVVAAGAEAMGLEHGPLPRNAPGCDGQGTCILGCPTEARRSTNVSYVPRALQAGAEVITGLPVTRILRRGATVVGVQAHGTDRFGAPRTLRVRAQAVVLACGSLMTPLLLQANDFHHPRLGRNLSLHPALGMWVRTDVSNAPWAAIPQGMGVRGHGDPDIKFEGFYLPPQLAAMSVPLHGPALMRWMGDADRVGQFGFMVRDRGVGRVLRGPGGRPLVHYDVTDVTLGKLQKGAALLAELLLRGGGREVLAGLGPDPVVRTVEQARRLAGAPLVATDFTLLGAHPLGTCAIGVDPATSVLDLDHRVRGTHNLYVVDGGSVPSSLGVNPQVTIMAMALRAAESLSEDLERAH